jgi:hypothetical protein
MTVGTKVGVSVAIGCEAGVSVGNNVFVDADGVGVRVLVFGWHAVSTTMSSIKSLFNTFPFRITSCPIYKKTNLPQSFK